MDNLLASLFGLGQPAAADAGDGSTGGALTDVGSDPSTPRGLQGTVLARLRGGNPSIAGGLALQATNPNSTRNLNNFSSSGVGGDLTRAAAASDPKRGRWGNFATGFTGGMAASEARDAQAAKDQRESTKSNVDNLKTMFDAASKMADEQRAEATQKATQARQESQDAETKRWHDIQHQDTLAKVNKGGSDATDWSTPTNMLNASRLEQAKLNELGLDHVSQRAINKALQDPLVGDDQKAQMRQAVQQAHQQFEAWRAAQPWTKGEKKPSPEADATGAPAAPAATPIAGGSVPSNPPSPDVKPRAWRAATAPDGSRWLIDQNTGEKQPINTAGAQPGMANQMTTTPGFAPNPVRTQPLVAPAAAAPAEEDDNEARV
jgi:hypothetical protein